MGTFANTGNIFAQATDPGSDAGAGAIWSDTDAGLIYRRNDANDDWVLIQTGTATHELLEAATHTDSVDDTVTRGSVIYGNSTPKWDELVLGAAGTGLISDGTDLAYRTIVSVKTGTDVNFTQVGPIAGTWYATTASVTLATRTNGKALIIVSGRPGHSVDSDIALFDDGVQVGTVVNQITSSQCIPVIYTMGLDGSTVDVRVRTPSAGGGNLQADDVRLEVIEVGS